jgi:hypothetical protein
LKALVTPGKGQYLVDARAPGHGRYRRPACRFDELDVKGVATLRNASFEEVRAKLYGGTIAGKAALDWEKGLQVKGNLDVRQIEIRALLQALAGRRASAEGSPPGRYSRRAPPAWIRLPRPCAWRRHSRCTVACCTGWISAGPQRFSRTRTVAKGGETRFDRLSGHLALDRGTKRVTKLNIASGSLSADGNVHGVAAGRALRSHQRAREGCVDRRGHRAAQRVRDRAGPAALSDRAPTVAGAAVGAAVLDRSAPGRGEDRADGPKASSAAGTQKKK